VLLLGACGGAPSRQSYQELPPGYLAENESVSAILSSLKVDEEYLTINKKEYPDLFRALIKSDYKKVSDLLGVSPITQKISTGNMDIVGIKTMREGKEATLDDLLYYAMKKGDMKKVKDLLAKGANPDSRNTSGYTALHVVYAKRYRMGKKEKLADMLLRAGANPNMKTMGGETLLHLVLMSDMDDKPQVIMYLISRGADPNLKSWDDKTVLQAVFDSDIKEKHETIKYLLAQGADPNTKDKSGSTLLQAVFASDMVDKPEMIRYLLAHGADSAQRDKYGNTVLHKALSPKLRYMGGVKDEDIISWIEPVIEQGADLDIRNKSGMTALSYATGRIEEYLLLKGARDYGSRSDGYVGLAKSPDGLSADNILGMSSLDILELTKESCHALLKDHGVKFTELEDIRDVGMPVMLKSDVGGIRYSHTDRSKDFSIMDCRLAAALVGWAPVLKRHRVVEVVHMRAYSPGARVGGGSKISGHTYALALDAAQFLLKDSMGLVVNDDWSDRRNSVEPCQASEEGDSHAQAELRNIACETGDSGVFSMILTPHYNRAHYDHLHLEVTDEVYGYVR